MLLTQAAVWRLSPTPPPYLCGCSSDKQHQVAVTPVTSIANGACLVKSMIYSSSVRWLSVGPFPAKFLLSNSDLVHSQIQGISVSGCGMWSDRAWNFPCQSAIPHYRETPLNTPLEKSFTKQQNELQIFFLAIAETDQDLPYQTVVNRKSLGGASVVYWSVQMFSLNSCWFGCLLAPLSLWLAELI